MSNQNNLKVYTQNGIYLFDINFGHYCRNNRYINYESLLCSNCAPSSSLSGLTIEYKNGFSRRYKLIEDLEYNQFNSSYNNLGEGI